MADLDESVLVELHETMSIVRSLQSSMRRLDDGSAFAPLLTGFIKEVRACGRKQLIFSLLKKYPDMRFPGNIPWPENGTAQFKASGQGNFYACIHRFETSDGQTGSLFEKASPVRAKKLGEGRFYERLVESGFGSGELFRTASCFWTVIGDQFDIVFLERVNTGKRISVSPKPFFALGKAVGEMNCVLGEVFQGFPVKGNNFKWYATGRSQLLEWLQEMSNDVDMVQDVMELIDRFFDNVQGVLEAAQSMSVVFCHNDLGSRNLYLDDGRILFLDWPNAAFNFAGSDLSAVLAWPKFKRISDAAYKAELEDSLIDGYKAILSKFGTVISRDEIRFAMSLSFLSGKLRTAINHRDPWLLAEAKKRAEFCVSYVSRSI